MMSETMSFPYQLRFPSLLSVPLPGGAVPRQLAAVARAQEPASTYGWDTMFAIRATDVNKQLAKPGVCPVQFAQTFGNQFFRQVDFVQRCGAIHADSRR